MTRNRFAALAVVALTAALVWALPAAAAPSAKVTTVNVLMGAPTEFDFKLSKAKVPKGVVVFKVTNKGKIPHDFKIAGKKTKSLAAG
jgi:hypothetical protein